MSSMKLLVGVILFLAAVTFVSAAVQYGDTSVETTDTPEPAPSPSSGACELGLLVARSDSGRSVKLLEDNVAKITATTPEGEKKNVIIKSQDGYTDSTGTEHSGFFYVFILEPGKYVFNNIIEGAKSSKYPADADYIEVEGTGKDCKIFKVAEE